MGYIDLHCDTLMVFAGENGSLYENRMAIDIKRLRKGGCTAQFFAVWLPDDEVRREMGLFTGEMTPGTRGWGLEPGAVPAKELCGAMAPEEWDDRYFERLYRGFYRELEIHADLIAPAYQLADLKKNETEGKMSAFLTLEDGRLVRGDLKRLEMLYEKGVRLITLTWNHDNCFGLANYKDAPFGSKGGGLSAFGKEAVERMNELGMMIDVSHLSDEGFYDVANITKKPFIASHSNARAFADCSRNMSDDMIRTLAKKGGVMGLNFAPGFLNEQFSCRDSLAARMAVHAKHIVNVGGEEVFGLGTDLDGTSGNMEIPSPDQMDLLWNALRKAGFTERQLELFMRKNAERIIGEILG